MQSDKQFYDKLNYLGGNLSLTPKLDYYVDLEVFFLECTQYLNRDTRTSLTILNWLYRYTTILSPSKIRRLIKNNKIEYNKFGLTYIFSILSDYSLIKTNWNILKPYCNETLHSSLKIPIKFKPNLEKYLKESKYVIEHCPEIYWRAHGVHQVASDIKSFLIKNNQKISLYQLAKMIHSPKSRVNYFYNSFNKFGIKLLVN
jgi:hypothetical protein